ncbi:MAG TPA: hypothetical protein VEQ65_06050, partial [Opitutus sp.]|nr:hypothetical protein [Opitutus sp.]
VTVFSVGRATAFDPNGQFDLGKPISDTNNPANNASPLFAGHAGTAYDGVADIAFIAIATTNGKFGGIRTANTGYFAAQGFTGIYAPGVTFVGPVFVHDITASGNATPVLLVGSVTDARVTGGTLKQDNDRAVRVSGISQLKFTAGATSHNLPLAAQPNQGKLEQNGQDITAQIVVNP